MNPHGYQYTYDQLNRLVAQDVFKPISAVGNNFSTATLSQDYRERISYDPNGNIQTYQRNMDNAITNRVNLDDLQYQYYHRDKNTGIKTTTPTANTEPTNQLAEVHDALGLPVLAGKDIGDQNANNYTYDEIGNLIGDQQEKLDITWTPTGKIAKINNINKNQIITFAYDPMGNRIMKQVEENGQTKYTFYTRDAQGNPLAIYSNAHPQPSDDPNQTLIGPLPDQLFWIETPLYGSSRIGAVMPRLEVSQTSDPNPDWIRDYFSGKRQYELTNHLGNVLATIKDEKKQVQLPTNTSTSIDYYDPIVYNATDYYPFGMPMPNRTFSLSSGSYRFGFNGKEKDNEIYGEGNAIDFGARIHDARVGRWLSVDPMSSKYPSISPYTFAGNNPIYYIDKNGKWLGVTFLFLESSGGVGLGYGVYYVEQIGLAHDEVGKTHFTTRTFLHINNQKLEESSQNPNVIIGGDINLISGNVKFDWNAETYLQSIGTSANDFKVPGGLNTKLQFEAPSLKVGVGVSGSISENSLTIGLGIQGGLTFNIMSSEITESISLTDYEASKVKSKTNISALNSYWSIGSITPNKDDQGNVTSYTSTVMTSTRNAKGNMVNVNTGIKITSGVKEDKNGNKSSNNVWASDSYVNEASKVENPKGK